MSSRTRENRQMRRWMSNIDLCNTRLFKALDRYDKVCKADAHMPSSWSSRERLLHDLKPAPFHNGGRKK